MSSAGVIPRQVMPSTPPAQDSSGLVTGPMQQAADVIGEFGVRLGRMQNAQQLQRSTLDATRQLDDLTLKYQNDPDPATAASRFADEAAQVHDKYAGALPDAESQAQFAHQFGSLAESRRIDIAAEAVKRQADEAYASVSDGLDHYAKLAAMAKSPQERDAVVAMASTSLQDAVKTHVMSAKTAQRLGAKWDANLAKNDVLYAMINDPAKVAKTIRDGGYPNLDPDVRPALLEKAIGEVRQREREVRAEMAQQRAEARATLADVGQQVAAGLPVDPTVLVPLKKIAATDPAMANHWNTLNAQVSIAAQLRGASPTEVAQAVNTLEIEGAKNPSAPIAAALMGARRFQQDQQAALNRDPLTWAAKQGTVQLTPLALNGSDAPQAWQSRVVAAEKTAQIYHREPNYLTASESSQLRDGLEHAPSAGEKLQILQTLIGGLGESRAAIELQRLASSSKTSGIATIAHAASLAMAGKQNTASDILAGQTLMKGKDNLSPKIDDMATAQAQIRTAFGKAPDMVPQILSSAMAIYAKRASDKGLSGADVMGKGRDIWNQAVQDAAGAGYNAQGERFGGIVNFNGRPTVAPASIKANDFAPILKGFTPDQLKQGSAYGGAPHYGNGKPFTGKLGDTYLIGIGDGRYVVSTTDPMQGANLLIDPQRKGGDTAYVLDLGNVLPWMGRKP